MDRALRPGVGTYREEAPAASPLPVGIALGATALAALGLLLVASAADTPAARRFGRAPDAWVARQAAGAAVGLLALLAARACGPRTLRRLALPGLAALLLLCAATLTPALGLRAGGARREVALGSLRFEPTALLIAWAPLALAVALRPDPLGRPRRAWPLWGLLALAGGVCLLQPNFGHLAALIAAALGTVLGLGPAARPLAARLLALLAACGPLALAFPYVRWRVASFLEPALTADTRGLQAIVTGASPLGLGLGRGGDKALLSTAPSDYLLAVTLEELGWLGAGAAVASLLLLALAVATAPSRHDAPRETTAVAWGVAASLAFPTLLHAAVNLRLAPVSGTPLPLLSASGSTTVAALLGVGVVLGLLRAPRH